MAKKKKSGQAESSGEGSASTRARAAGEAEPSTSALIICRNKHWRYISSFHGPWLQLPPEVLESLAHTNYLSPRPRPIDPAVFFDLLNIRRHVDEATTLAVRATNGLPGGGGGGGGGKLSRERRHRMRELATGKLGAAYRLDEIAASVATMQSASTLEDVAQLVLHRSPADVDARYVHFFHEKIPSRMMAQCSSLHTLDAIVAERPADPSPLRTRALTRLFNDDYANSARDLTDALAAARYLAQHRAPDAQLVPAARDRRHDARLPAHHQPSSLETQLLFHRAGVYLAIACAHVPAALDGLQAQEAAHAARHARAAAGEQPAPETSLEADARRLRAESRKQMRQNAKRALRDYTAFLSHFDYTPGISPDVADDFLRRYQHQANGHAHTNGDYQAKLDRLLNESSASSPSDASDALTPYKKPHANIDRNPWPTLPPPPVYTLNQLFDSVPPASLPPYPLPPNTPPSPIPTNESLTYHPLLPEALHSLLLVHSLLQTPAKELLRHAHNAARLLRLLDGYPIFLAARSPARSDWVEVLRRGGNWIGLTSSWEKLCRPSSPGQGESSGPATSGAVAKLGGGGSGARAEQAETKGQRRERQKHEAILEALADERVVDEESFQRAVRAREKRFRDDEKADAAMYTTAPSPASISNGTASEKPEPTPPKRWAQDDAREHPISTERAEAISRWVRDAPALTSESNSGTKKRRKKGSTKKPALSKASSTGLEGSLVSLAVDGAAE